MGTSRGTYLLLCRYSHNAQPFFSQNLQNCLDLVTAFEAAKAAREAKRQSGHGSSTPQASSSNVKKAAPKASTSTAKKVSGKKATSSEPVKDDSLSLKKHEERRIEAKKKAAKKSSASSEFLSPQISH